MLDVQINTNLHTHTHTQSTHSIYTHSFTRPFACKNCCRLLCAALKMMRELRGARESMQRIFAAQRVAACAQMCRVATGCHENYIVKHICQALYSQYTPLAWHTPTGQHKVPGKVCQKRQKLRNLCQVCARARKSQHTFRLAAYCRV